MLEAEVLRDEGYSEEEIQRMLIVIAIQQWADEHGRPPTIDRWRATGGAPSVNVISKVFGRWGNAIVAAGFPKPSGFGSRGRGTRPRSDDEEDSRVHSQPLLGPAKPPERQFHTAAAERLLRPDGDSADSLLLLQTLEQFRREEERLETEIMSRGRNGYVALNSRSVLLSRGMKVKRLAEAMARLRGLKWWKLDLERREAYLALAEVAMQALELVESDQRLMAQPGDGARL